MKRDMKKVYLKVYGCQMNEYDSEQVCLRLKDGGYQLVDAETEADVILFNTCSVRSHAEDRVFGQLHMLSKTKEKRPDLIVGVMGCMANAYKEKLLKDFPHLDFISGTKDFDRIIEILVEVVEMRSQRSFISEEDRPFVYSKTVFGDHKLKAYVPIMRGCDNYCSYCIVPYVRGREISRPVKEIIDEITFLSQQGVKEIMLLGQNVNSYGKGLAESIDFPDFLKAVAQINDIKIIRFMTSHPKDVSTKLFDVIKTVEKIEKHLHLPIQSGSDTLLEKMNRQYRLEDYKREISELRTRIPDISITTDIIVGFCGETEREYNETKKVMQEIEFDSAFIFKYSPRKGTKAYELEDTVAQSEKLRRNNELLEVQRQISFKKNKTYIGRHEKALVYAPSKKKKNELKAKTIYDREVVFPGDRSIIGSIVVLELCDIINQTFIGRLIKDN